MGDDLSVNSRFDAWMLLATGRASPDSPALRGWPGPLWPRPTPNLPATCSLVCSSMCYSKPETIGFWSKACKEGAPGQPCLLGKPLSRLLKPFRFSLSYIFKILYSVVFLLQKQSRITVENIDKKKNEKRKKQPTIIPSTQR